MNRAELLSNKGYWLSTIQLELYAQIEQYMKDNDLNRTQLAEKLGVTKGYISQILNGDFDHKISKLVDLALLMGKAPQIEYVDLSEAIKQEQKRNADFSFTVNLGGSAMTRTSVDSVEEHIPSQQKFSFESEKVA